MMKRKGHTKFGVDPGKVKQWLPLMKEDIAGGKEKCRLAADCGGRFPVCVENSVGWSEAETPINALRGKEALPVCKPPQGPKALATKLPGPRDVGRWRTSKRPPPLAGEGSSSRPSDYSTNLRCNTLERRASAGTASSYCHRRQGDLQFQGWEITPGWSVRRGGRTRGPECR